jgi:hypothetical protein
MKLTLEQRVRKWVDTVKDFYEDDMVVNFWTSESEARKAVYICETLYDLHFALDQPARVLKTDKTYRSLYFWKEATK